MSNALAILAAPQPVRPPTLPGQREAYAVGAACFVAYLIIAGAAALRLPFPNNFDELAHLSYATDMARHGLAGLDFRTMRLLSPSLGPGFTSTPNYLNHPPAYYLLLSRFLPPDGWPTPHTVLILRMLNLCLSACAVGCALAVGMLRRLGPEQMLYNLMVVVTPALWCIGGAINNDNLALLGGTLGILGAQLMESQARPRAGLLLLAIGCILAMLAKLTAGIMTSGFTMVFLTLRWRASGQHPSIAALSIFFAVLGLACFPYVRFLLAYGSPAPVTPAFRQVYSSVATIFREQHLHLHGWQAGNHPDLPGYCLAFARWLLADWNPVTQMTGMLGGAIQVVPASMLALALCAWLSNARPGLGQDWVVAAGGLTLALILPLHLAFSYGMYRAVGSPPFDAVPRYYLPVALPILPASACWTLARIGRPAATAFRWLLMIGLGAASLGILGGGALWLRHAG